MQSVLITGTSSGFGLAGTLELARRGWRVFATMRNQDRQDHLIDAVRSNRLEQSVEIIALDVTDQDSVRAAVADVLARNDGRLEAVVHNAGIAVAGAFEDIPETDLRRVMETNFFGVMTLTRELLPTFRSQRRGRIVAVSSDSAFAGEPTNSIYCASKWALEGWAESLAFELEPFNIDVALVEPGPFKTEVWNSTKFVNPPGTAYGPLLEKIEPAFNRHFERHAGDPAVVAKVIASALEAKKPKFRNPVGAVARLNHALRGKLPNSMMRNSVKSYMGIKGLKL